MKTFHDFINEKTTNEGIMDFFGGGKPSSGGSVSGAITMPDNNMTGGMANEKGASSVKRGYPIYEFFFPYSIPMNGASKDIIALANKSQGKKIKIPCKVIMPELDKMQIKAKGIQGMIGGTAKKFGPLDGSVVVFPPDKNGSDQKITIHVDFIMDTGLAPERYEEFHKKVEDFSFLNRKPGPHKPLQVII